MSTRLEKILADIDPSKTYDQTFARADDAVNSFSGTYAQITVWGQFNEYLAGFIAHVEAKILKLNSSPIDSDFYGSKCLQLLCRIYGPNGEKAAFEMARTGKEGGLLAVLKAVALRMAEEYAENEINARVSDYWSKLSLDEQSSATDEYFEKYGHLLPAEMIEGSAARLRANFLKVLEKHPRMLRKYRNLNG